MVSERLLCQFIVQLFPEDLELGVSLSQLLLEPGNLLSVLLILSPAVFVKQLIKSSITIGYVTQY